MSLHNLTRQSLKNDRNFSKKVNQSISTIMDLVDNYSAISDINFLLHKHDKEIPGIKLPDGEGSWLPTRNLVRLLAKIASLQITGIIEEVQVESMSCGCDYFEGNVFLTIDGKQFGGAYKWQWTAFEDRQRHYDRFTLFPNIDEEIVVKN